MNLSEKDIQSLIVLLDDEDEEIFLHVQEQLLLMATEVIPCLENAWEKSFNPLQQVRIEDLIHKIQFEQVQHHLMLWKMSGGFDLLEGLLIINRYQYPDIDEQTIINEIEQIRRAAWLTLMYEMSEIEKIKALNDIIYNKFGFSGNTKNFHAPENSYISQVITRKKGNPIMLAALYSMVAQRLDIPVQGVNLPRHFILAYLNEASEKPNVLFYINAFNRGQIFGKKDIYSFLRQLQVDYDRQFFDPCDNIAIITRVLRNLVTAYSQSGNLEKMEEIQRLLLSISSE